MGTAQVRKGGLIFEPLGVISGGDQHRGGCIGANPLHGHQFGRSLSNQSIKLLVELGDLLREPLVATCHRAQRELGGAASTSEGFGPGRNREALATSLAVESPHSSLFSPSGAVMSRFWSWLAAPTRAFSAERRVIRKVRIISTSPSALLGWPVAVPASTARAAASASSESDLPARYWSRRLGRITSERPLSVGPSRSESDRLRRSPCLLLRRVSEGRTPLPSPRAFCSLPGSPARSGCPDACRSRPGRRRRGRPCECQPPE